MFSNIESKRVVNLSSRAAREGVALKFRRLFLKITEPKTIALIAAAVALAAKVIGVDAKAEDAPVT